MQTIVEPKQHVDKLWGKQRVKEDKIFRLMKYVLRVDHEGKVLLHNVVTGRLVVLDQEEAAMLNQLPAAYSPVMEQLVTGHYLVPEDYDEHQQVINLRDILSRMLDTQTPKDITYYTILPTTACNARCWYCYEKGINPITMSEKTANDVIEFIVKSCGGKPIKIRWFGGEPTMAPHRIDQISQGLRDRDIVFTSNITSNGYLFDEEMIKKAKNLWNTYQVSISIDGTEEKYNQIKVFPGVKDNPYRRMMDNVEMLLSHEINVVIRMNYDRESWEDFPKLLRETQDRFKSTLRLMVYPHQINYDMPYDEWKEMESWLDQKNDEMYDMAEANGNYHHSVSLPSLIYVMCGAASNDSIVILPDGRLVSCPELLDDDQVKGTVRKGIMNQQIVKSWKKFADYERCHKCVFFPDCGKPLNCNSKDRCCGKAFRLNRFGREIKKYYDNVIAKEVMKNGFSGAQSRDC